MKSRKSSQRGQIVIEYILLLVVAVTIATIMIKGLVNRSTENPGIVVKKWREIQAEVGGDLPDKCTGNSCSK